MASTHSALSLVDRLYQTVWQKATKRLAAGSSFDPASGGLSECRDVENDIGPSHSEVTKTP